MGKSLKVTKEHRYTCDTCGRIAIVPSTEKRSGWVILSLVEVDGLRLFEKPNKVERYESFHIPNKVEKVYCSRHCAEKYLQQSIQAFVK